MPTLKPESVTPARQVNDLSRGLLTLLVPENSNLGIRDLAKLLRMSHKETLLLLVRLESQGVLIWEFASRTYIPGPDSLCALLNVENRAITKWRSSGTKAKLLAKAA